MVLGFKSKVLNVLLNTVKCIITSSLNGSQILD